MTEQIFTCDNCSGQFSGRKRKYCTVKCGEVARRRARGILPRLPAACHQTHECFWCGSMFQPKRKGRDKYCSRECCFEFMAARSALVDQMGASHKVMRNKCDGCGERFHGAQSARWCSSRCMYSFGYKTKVFTCKECGANCKTSYGDRRSSFCSKACSVKNYRRIRRKMDRARLRHVQVEVVDPIKVFDRDGWRCQICGCKTPRERRGSIKPNAPELDHIVPLSVGGEHSYRNTQCACRGCNLSKGNKIYGQIPMFAT